MLGGMVAVRCPRELDPIMRRAGACGSPQVADGSSRIGPVLRHLQRTTDPLFRQARISLDE